MICCPPTHKFQHLDFNKTLHVRYSTVEKHNIIDALGNLALILTYIIAFIVRGDQSDFVHEWFPLSGYGFFVCFLYLVVLPAPIVYYYRKETKSEQASSKDISTQGGNFSNPLSGDVFDTDSVEEPLDMPSGGSTSRVAIAKLQRSAKETRDTLHAKEIENEAQRAEIEDLREQLVNSGVAPDMAGQTTAGASDHNVAAPAPASTQAPAAPPAVLRAFIGDETLDEETREAARSVLAAQTASQIEMLAVTTSRVNKITELNDERRFKDRYSSAIAAVQSNDDDMAMAATEWAAFRSWLGANRLLRHEAHMGKVLGRDVALADLKLLEQEDVDELSSEMTRVEQARFKAAVQTLQEVGEQPNNSA
eukprot:COSAG02_NODE_1456_length_12512_cov_17.368082_1_plen_364_part_00